MNEELFSVYDAAAQRYLPVFGCPTIEVAIRGFGEACANPESPFHKHPVDFTLFHIGGFDAESGELVAVQQPHKVSDASSFVHGQQLELEQG